jgi:hypothetical protein
MKYGNDFMIKRREKSIYGHTSIRLSVYTSADRLFIYPKGHPTQTLGTVLQIVNTLLCLDEVWREKHSLLPMPPAEHDP